MFGLETLDVAIGVIFVFLLVSILCSAIREAFEAVLKTRAAFLWLGIRELLHDKNTEGLADSFYNHPLIYSLFPGDFDKNKVADKPRMFAHGRGAPSYIPSSNFAVALMDIAARGPITDGTRADADSPVLSLESIRTNIANIQNPAVQRVLLAAVDSAQGDLNRAQANVEAWFNSAMDRVSGWYKRTTQWWLFGIGVIVAVGMNINTLTIADFLYRTPAVRDALVKKAEAVAQNPKFLEEQNAKEFDQRFREAQKELSSLQIPMGWEGWRRVRAADIRQASDVWKYILVPVVGWLLTAFAATMGAPFWFDLLNKVMVIRSTVKPHEKSPEEGSEDRQPKTPPAPAVQQPAPAPQQGPAPPPPPPPPQPAAAAARFAADLEADVDHTDSEITEATADEDLPQAKGGVK